MKQVLRWLAYLPLLEEHHLEMLVGIDAWTVREVLRELHERGLAASLVIDSPEFASPRRLYHLTDAGVVASARALRVTVAQVCQRYPVGEREILRHIIRAETAVGIASFAAALAAGIRDTDEIEALHIQSSHWTPHPGRLPNPPAVEAYGCLHAWDMTASFALAWDRAAAPTAHRRGRVAAWYRADEAARYHEDRRLPSLLLACPDERTLQQWEIAVERSAARRARDILPLYFTTATELTTRGPLGACWRQPGGSRRLTLADCLAWRPTPGACNEVSTPPPTAYAASRPMRDNDRQDGVRRGGSGARARSGAPRRRTPRAERWATLALALSASQKTLLAWVGHHPLLPVTHLATHLALSTRSTMRLLEELAHHGLVATECTGSSRNADEPRYVLTATGAAFLAARDGVPVGVYLREGVMAAADVEAGARRATRPGARAASPVRLAHLRRRPEHTEGVQRFALALTREAARQRSRGRDHRLLAWLNDAEGQVWFRHEGRTRHIWPDARFWYRADGVVYDLLLEWDRGLVRRRDYARKFAAYAAYLSAHGGRQDGRVCLIVVTTAAAAGRVRAAVSEASRRCAQLAVSTWIITQETVREARVIATLRPATVTVPDNGSPFRSRERHEAGHGPDADGERSRTREGGNDGGEGTAHRDGSSAPAVGGARDGISTRSAG